MCDIRNVECALIKPVSDPPSFVVNHEKCLVAPVVHFGDVDRTANNETELILAQFGKLLLEGCSGIEGIVPEKFECSSMQLVGAIFRNDVHLVGTEAILRRICLALNLEFLYGVLRQNNGRCVERGVGVNQAV